MLFLLGDTLLVKFSQSNLSHWSLIANHRKLIFPISGNVAWNSNHHNPGVNILKRNRSKDEKELLEFYLFKRKFNKCRILKTF